MNSSQRVTVAIVEAHSPLVPSLRRPREGQSQRVTSPRVVLLFLLLLYIFSYLLCYGDTSHNTEYNDPQRSMIYRYSYRLGTSRGQSVARLLECSNALLNGLFRTLGNMESVRTNQKELRTGGTCTRRALLRACRGGNPVPHCSTVSSSPRRSSYCTLSLEPRNESSLRSALVAARASQRRRGR